MLICCQRWWRTKGSIHCQSSVNLVVLQNLFSCLRPSHFVHFVALDFVAFSTENIQKMDVRQTQQQKKRVFCLTEDEASETEPPPPYLTPTTYSPASLITLEGCKFYSSGGVGRVRLPHHNPQAGFLLDSETHCCKDPLLSRRVRVC